MRLPLSSLQKKGFAEDEVQITVPQLKHDYLAPAAIDSKDMLAVGIGNEVSIKELENPGEQV